jgi:putative ABC transport system permease protein
MTVGLPLLRDLRIAFRALRRSPGFTFIAVLTLGLGIGANTSAFGLLNEILLRPVPYPNADRVDRIYRSTAQNARGGVSPADYADLVAEVRGYGEIAGYALTEMSLSAPGEPAAPAAGARVAPNLFRTLGLEPELGRGFRPEEDAPGNHRVLVLSHEFWQERFAGDPHVLGRTLRVDGEVHEIVGVLPARFRDWRHLGGVDLFRPLALTAAERSDRTTTPIRLVGRRSAALTGEQAAALVAAFGGRLEKRFPAAHAGSTWRTVPIQDTVAPENVPGMLAMVVGLSALVLLIACSNLANLLLARTMARARELAVRSALGASRFRLLRPLFFESLLLSLAGGACAILMALWTSDWLKARLAGQLEVEMAVDWRVLSWAFGACLFTIVGFGVAPALFALRMDLNGTLKSGARGATPGRGHQRFRDALIVGQFALAMVLLAGATVFVRGFGELTNRRLGWSSERLVTGTVILPPSSYETPEEIAGFQRQALRRLESLPGVASASVSYVMPFFGLAETRRYVVEGRPMPPAGREPGALINGVSPRYFETVGTRLLSGRPFTDGDAVGSPRVFIVNQTMANGLFPGESPVGRRIGRVLPGGIEWGEIVGIAQDIQTVAPGRPALEYQLYQPLAQEPRPVIEIAVRTAGIPAGAVVESVRSTVAGIDPDLPVRSLGSADDAIAWANNQPGMMGDMLGFLAILGLVLASLGVFGVVTRTVAQRTHEFGIRLALGAVARDITRLVLGAGVRLAFVGSALGLVGAYGLARLLASFFDNMKMDALGSMAGVTILLVAVSLVASYLPARSASRISPADSLGAQ